MKKLFFIGFLFLSGISFSQEYLPMLVDGNKWSVDTYYCPFTDVPPFKWTVTNQITINGEVEINGKIYKQIYKGDQISCLLREENGIVYKYNENNDNERVLFDFNIEIGDSYLLANLAFGYDYCSGTNQNLGIWYIEVSAIETQFLAGTDRKVIKFIDQFYPNGGDVMYWIEGIGTVAGLGHSWAFQDITCGSSLACFETNDTSYFMFGATSCDNTTLSTNDFDKKKIIVYPNPVINTSLIQLPIEAEIDSIVIYNIEGKIIVNENVTLDYFKINSMNYASGLYLYQVYSKGKIIKTDRFTVK